MTEYFQFLLYRWDVTKAQQIAANLPVHRFNAQPWFGWLGLIRVDEDHVRTADLNQPLIVVKIRELGGDPLIIDGYASPITVRSCDRWRCCGRHLLGCRSRIQVLGRGSCAGLLAAHRPSATNVRRAPRFRCSRLDGCRASAFRR